MHERIPHGVYHGSEGELRLVEPLVVAELQPKLDTLLDECDLPGDVCDELKRRMNVSMSAVADIEARVNKTIDERTTKTGHILDLNEKKAMLRQEIAEEVYTRIDDFLTLEVFPQRRPDVSNFQITNFINAAQRLLVEKA